jgi:hypothetical protein
VIISVASVSANGSPVILVNSRETPPDNLDQAVSRKLGVPPKWTAYVEAENTLPWSDVVKVIDVVEGIHVEVVPLTTAPMPILDTRGDLLSLWSRCGLIPPISDCLLESRHGRFPGCRKYGQGDKPVLSRNVIMDALRSEQNASGSAHAPADCRKLDLNFLLGVPLGVPARDVPHLRE